MRVCIIGGGNMGCAFARAFVRTGFLSPRELLVVEPQESVRSRIAGELGCAVLPVSDREIAKSDVIVLAVKPQEALRVCADVRPHLTGAELILSIMTGITLAQLGEALGGHSCLVRCMPNTPAQIGEGVSTYLAAPEIAPLRLELVEKLLGATGVVIRVNREEEIDISTALSGSGPAYVFYFLENFLGAADELGFSGEGAKRAVIQTVRGAVALWEKSGEDVGEMRAKVTSKGGTTAAAIRVFEEGKWGEVLRAGIKAAYQRARELSKG